MHKLNVPVCDPYVVNALDAIKFIILYPGDDPRNNNFKSSFKPKMAHQVFGTAESIFGYQKLQICIFYHHNTAHCLVIIKYDDVIKNDLIKPDNIYQQLHAFLPEGFYTDPEAFIKDFVDMHSEGVFGVPKYTFTNVNRSGSLNYYVVTKCTTEENGFIEFHKRYETLIIWFIDAANFIDLHDPRWEVMYIYEQQKNGIVTPVGFCTVYKFYAYPDKIRARISQFFILPTHQCLGLGKRFLACIYQMLYDIPNLKDIVVEDPSEVFQKMRNAHDAKVAMKLSIMQQPNLYKGYTAEIERHIERICKVPKHQCRMVYEIVVYANVMDNDFIKEEFLSKVVKPRIISEYKASLKKSRNSLSKHAINKRTSSMIRDTKSEAEKLYQKYVTDVLQMTAHSIRK